MTLLKFTCFPCAFYLLYCTSDYWFWSVSWLSYFVTLLSLSWILSRAFVRNVLCKTMLDRVDPSDKAILITGCASGFGFATAVELNRRGYYVIASARDPNDSRMQKLAASVSNPRRFKMIPLEVTDCEHIKKAHETVSKLIENREEGVNQLYALINNAGISDPSFIEFGETYDIEPFSRHIDVNYLAPVRLTKVMLPLIRKAKGRIVNIGSVSTRASTFSMSAYSASKGALARFSDILRLEVSPFGVKVIEIEPTFFKTAMMDAARLNDQFTRSFKSSSDQVRETYKHFMSKAIALVHRVQSDERLVVNDLSVYIDVVVEAVESYEPDFLYTVVAPALAPLVQLNMLVPWEVCYGISKALEWFLTPRNIDSNSNQIALDSK